jgi:transmembrane sensor
VRLISAPGLYSRDQEAAEWCLALSGGDLPAADRSRFDAWVSDPDNACALADAVRLWNCADAAAELPEMIQLRGVALDRFRRANRSRWSARGPGLWIAGIAAVLLVLIGSAAWLTRAPFRTYETGIGERQVAMLPDGSRLSLDADSRVDVGYRDGVRNLTLVSGRAKFDVAHDPLRPFVVAAGDKLVVATGTSFSVELLQNRMHVLLYEGHVAVLDVEDGRRVAEQVRTATGLRPADEVLTPGHELVAALSSPTPAILSPTPQPPAPAWESGQISFDDEPLPSAVERLNRYSTRQLVIGDPAVARMRVSGVFSAGDTGAFVEGVAALDRVTARREGDRIVLRSR